MYFCTAQIKLLSPHLRADLGIKFIGRKYAVMNSISIILDICFVILDHSVFGHCNVNVTCSPLSSSYYYYIKFKTIS